MQCECFVKYDVVCLSWLVCHLMNVVNCCLNFPWGCVFVVGVMVEMNVPDDVAMCGWLLRWASDWSVWMFS